MSAPTSSTYVSLLREHRDFRLLWLGQVVSQLGDWFNAIAVYTLVLEVTGSATAVAVMMVMQQLPTALVGPWAGVIVDRFDRRRVMIAADVVRGIVILGLLWAGTAATVWIAFAVVGLTVIATAFFEPARAAIVPSVVPVHELVLANSLASATWSAMLAIGAAVGGAVTAWLGRDVAFVLNSLSFLASGACIAAMRVRAVPRGDPAGGRRRAEAGFGAGLRYLREAPSVLAYVSVKGAWAVAGGVLLLLTVFGERVFRVGGGAALGIGTLYAARGVGAGIGALAVRAVVGTDRDRLEAGMAPAYLAVGAGYAALAIVPNLWLASLAVVAAHAAGSVLWVASTVLLQMTVPDQFRGRVFAIDFALMTLVASAASFLTGLGLDRLALSPRLMAALLGTLFVVPAAVWAVRGRRRRGAAAAG